MVFCCGVFSHSEAQLEPEDIIPCVTPPVISKQAAAPPHISRDADVLEVSCACVRVYVWCVHVHMRLHLHVGLWVRVR